MRFYTKEWYDDMQGVEIEDFKRIPDGDYSDEDIAALYEKAKKKEIAFERKQYNSKPFFLSFDDLLTEDAFDPEDWLFVPDAEDGDASHPTSAMEVRKQLEKEQRLAMEEFSNRPPFDPAETIHFFETSYQSKLNYYQYRCPAWMVQQVDRRLLALGLLPESAYKRFREECREKKKMRNKINREAAKTLAKQKIPVAVEEALELHDASLLSLRQKGSRCLMVVCRDGIWTDVPTPYRRVVFHHATVLEKDPELRVRKYKKDGEYCSNTYFLYQEIYHTVAGYEAHMLFSTSKGLAYLTIACSDITFEDGVMID